MNERAQAMLEELEARGPGLAALLLLPESTWEHAISFHLAPIVRTAPEYAGVAEVALREVARSTSILPLTRALLDAEELPRALRVELVTAFRAWRQE